MQNAASQIFSSAQLFAMGASAPAEDGFSYMPDGGLVDDGKVTLRLPPMAERALAAKKEQQNNKLKNTSMPANRLAPPRRATQLRQRGYNRYAALKAVHSPKPVQAFKAPATAPAPKVPSKPAVLALPQTKTVNISQLAVNPTKPTYASRAKYWGQSTGLVCAL